MPCRPVEWPFVEQVSSLWQTMKLNASSGRRFQFGDGCVNIGGTLLREGAGDGGHHSHADHSTLTGGHGLRPAVYFLRHFEISNSLNALALGEGERPARVTTPMGRE